MVTSVQKRMEPRRSLLGASVDVTDARHILAQPRTCAARPPSFGYSRCRPCALPQATRRQLLSARRGPFDQRRSQKPSLVQIRCYALNREKRLPSPSTGPQQRYGIVRNGLVEHNKAAYFSK